MGGIRLVNKICSRCETEYKGIHNQQLCSICKEEGFDRICKHCNVKFISKSRYTNHCNVCSADMIWKRGTFPDRGKKITEAKLNFYQTDYGKQIARRVGDINSIKLKEFYQSEEGIAVKTIVAEKNSNILKSKIAAGTFTPKITNTFTHWTAEIYHNGEIKKFRSSWEACIWYSNRQWLYEYIRIPYVGTDNKTHTYIVDFYDPSTNTLYEVKPEVHIENVCRKIDAASAYCKQNNLTYTLITEKDLVYYIDKEIFHGENKKQLDKCLK
jgi:hypothetical protein